MTSARQGGRCATAMQVSDRVAAAIDRIFRELASPNWTAADARSGPYALRLNFASPALAQAFLPSFIRRDAGGPADLEMAFTSDAYHDLAGLVPDPPDQFRLLADRDFYAVWQPGPLPVLFVLDRRRGRGLVWLASGEAPPWVRSRPALSLIHAFGVDTPWMALHGGAVGLGERFVLLAGKGHSGKTTSALACAQAGWHYAGDDFVLAHSRSGRIEPLYCSARLRLDLVDSFRAFLDAGTVMSDVDGERRHELSLAALEGRVRGGALAAIFLPRRRGASRPEFVPARRADAFAALMAATTIELPGWPNVTAEKIAAVIGLAPVFFVDTGTEPQAIPDAFALQLERL